MDNLDELLDLLDDFSEVVSESIENDLKTRRTYDK